MGKRIFLFLFIFFIVISLLSGCGADSLSINPTLESMKSTDKGSFFPLDIEMLNSNKYKEEIEEYIKKLNPGLDILKSNYEFGDLDGDLIPELVLYIERNPEDLNDQGSLVVYKLVDNEFRELDRAPMNYDNANYLLKLGMLSESQQGIFLTNQVGLKAGVTYGYIVENEKLRSILNPTRVNLISVNAMETIEDIDGDGILEFGILTIDPETEETTALDANKVLLWYKWDGIDGAKFIRKDTLQEKTKRFSGLSEGIDDLSPGSENFIEDLQMNIDNYSKSDLSSLLSSHIKLLEINSSYHSLDVAALFSKYIKKSSLLDIIESYNLSDNKINDSSYLDRNKVLEREPDLKSMLMKNLNKGYYLSLDNGRYIYTPYYSKLGNLFSKSLTRELQGYLAIMAKSVELPYIHNYKLLINKIDLAKRLQEIENYRITYSYSDHIENINNLYNDYLFALLFYTSDGQIQNDANIIEDKEINKLVDTLNHYPETYFAQVINKMLVLINKNQNIINPQIKNEITQMIR